MHIPLSLRGQNSGFSHNGKKKSPATFPQCGKKVPTSVSILPFSAVWSDESGIWVPMLYISVPSFQSFASLPA
jgi:hypothetical protein